MQRWGCAGTKRNDDTSIHQTITFEASAATLYGLLTDATEFSAATGADAVLVEDEGAAFSLFGGFISGRHIELVPGQRVVQAWRGADWPPGLYSIVRFNFEERQGVTKMTLHQDGYPDGPSPSYPSWREHLASNWPVFYFGPMARHLAATTATPGTSANDGEIS